MLAAEDANDTVVVARSNAYSSAVRTDFRFGRAADFAMVVRVNPSYNTWRKY